MTQDIRKLVQRFYEIVNGASGDFSEIFAKDFHLGIMKGFPYGGEHIGLAAVNKFFEDLGSHFEFWAVDTDRFIEVDSTTMIVTGKYRSKASATDKSFEMETIHLWTAKSGVLTTYKHYCDTAIISEAMNHNVPQY
ncbi:nuclear transport factor 2 family protein [Pontibaca salina]|uniref:SnoaL-like domain-containing protein n=1 Tax=Pontibaca salina TaxID=2795731 RepID=A0A934HQP4_9RHOB|nr:nuclear transport factor 2 family protein [Pontibaca salina]MBI6629957.1 hypothetical protein [Pontibaca salina]